MSLPQLRYEFANVSHSCGQTPYAIVIIANTSTAPKIDAAQVEGSAERFGRRTIAKAIAMPMPNATDAQMSRPAAAMKAGPQSRKFGIWSASGLVLVSGIAPESPQFEAKGKPVDQVRLSGPARCSFVPR